MKHILVALALMIGLAAPAFAQKSKTDLTTEINTNLPNNTSGAITPTILRSTLNDMVSSWQQLVPFAAKVASTTNLTLSGAQTIDAVSAVAGDVVLAKDQTIPSENGPYVVAAGTWSRVTGWITGNVSSGASVLVTSGGINGGYIFAITTTGTITVGSTSVTFTQIPIVQPYAINGFTVGWATASSLRVYGGSVAEDRPNAGNPGSLIKLRTNFKDIDFTVLANPATDTYGIDTCAAIPALSILAACVTAPPNTNSQWYIYAYQCTSGANAGYQGVLASQAYDYTHVTFPAGCGTHSRLLNVSTTWVQAIPGIPQFTVVAGIDYPWRKFSDFSRTAVYQVLVNGTATSPTTFSIGKLCTGFQDRNAYLYTEVSAGDLTLTISGGSGNIPAGAGSSPYKSPIAKTYMPNSLFYGSAQTVLYQVTSGATANIWVYGCDSQQQ